MDRVYQEKRKCFSVTNPTNLVVVVRTSSKVRVERIILTYIGSMSYRKGLPTLGEEPGGNGGKGNDDETGKAPR